MDLILEICFIDGYLLWLIMQDAHYSHSDFSMHFAEPLIEDFSSRKGIQQFRSHHPLVTTTGIAIVVTAGGDAQDVVPKEADVKLYMIAMRAIFTYVVFNHTGTIFIIF